MHRFYFDETRREGERVRLDDEEARHATLVLRLKKGAEIALLDGLGNVYAARLDETKDRVTALITGRLPDNEPRASVTLYQGLPKAGKMEVILQKATELGIHAVQPVQFARCVRELGKNADKTLLRWRRVVRDAAKQCGRGQIPLVGQPKPLSELLSRIREHALVLAPWEEAASVRIADVLRETDAREIAVVIGPEGGMTEDEIAQLAGAGGRIVTLGSRILRTETAGLAALASILTLTGDL